MAIDARRWAALQPFFERALDLTASGRQACIDELRRQDPELGADLAALLDHHRAGADEQFLESGPLPFPDREARAGQSLGAYTLISPIGAGGMGSVWRAERNDGRFVRPAAIKLLNVSLRGNGRDRFTREGTILARLTHPRIAHLLDAGVTAMGQPYLVLEYVDGVPIDRYCGEQGLDIAARLRLFLEVLDAVAHAHANLIVHRDLKPSNVLVASDGHVKLLDFGIAKLLNDDTGEVATVTREGEAAMTPSFATPEQVTGGAVTTATDIYQLGVLLFLLLTGRHPARASLHSPAELMNAIVETEPPRPSSVVDNVRTARLLTGDLDVIVEKALRKRPSERYQSATAFGADLQRHLDHEPISARPAAFSYRALKFVRRHRWPVAAAAIVFAALAIGLYAVNRERVIAERRFQQLRRLSNEVFTLDSQIRNLSGATKAREQLVEVTLEYFEGLAADARGNIDLAIEVSGGYWRVGRIQGVPTDLSLGNLAKAEATLAKGDAMIAPVLAARPRDGRALRVAAGIAHDRAIVAQTERRNDDARAYASKAVDLAERALAIDTPSADAMDDLLTTLSNMALARINMHDYDEGVRLARREVELASKPGVNSRHLPFGLSLLANALRLQGELDESLKAIQKARSASDNLTYPSETLRMFDRYGVVLREGLILGEDRAPSLGRTDEAVTALREAFDIAESNAKRDANDTTSRSRVGTSARELGDILRWQHPDEALTYYDLALTRLGEIKNNVKARRDRALALATSSYPLRQLGRPRDAHARITEALAILGETKDYPAERLKLDGEAVVVLQAEADYEAAEGHVARGIELYEQLLQRVMAASPDTDNDLRDTYSLALLYSDLADLCRQHAATSRAVELDDRTRALWTHWNQKRPNNPLVLQQLARR